MYVLHSAPGTCALASVIVAEEIGCPYRLERVDFASKQQTTPEYLRLNPLGRVPVLEGDGLVLTEVSAIMIYLAQKHPGSALVPEDPAGLARVIEFNGFMSSTVHVAHAHGPRGSRWADEPSSFADMKRKVPQTMRAGMTIVEQNRLKGPWVLGDRYSVADAYLFTIAGWLEGDGVPMADFPKIAAHFEAMKARPAVQRALAANARREAA